ncbi:MAG: type I restriction enzyme S subunit, partial [Cyclobacteriaceae bacterium]
NSINQDFVFIQLKTARYYKFIEEIYRGNANQASITLEDLFGFILFLPTSIGEQKAIAKILSDMDNEIEMLESKKAKYMQIKEGMMQELLTGKTRLVS